MRFCHGLLHLYVLNNTRCVLKFHCPHVHNLVGLTAEGFGTKAGQKIFGHWWQKWCEPYVEPVRDESGIRQLCCGELVDYHLPDGVKYIRVRLIAAVCLHERLHSSVTHKRWFLRSFLTTALMDFTYHVWKPLQGIIQRSIKALEEKLPSIFRDAQAAWQFACE